MAVAAERERGLAASLRICAPEPVFGRGKLATSLALSHGRVMAMERHGGADGAGALATAFTLSAKESQRVRSGALDSPGFSCTTRSASTVGISGPLRQPSLPPSSAVWLFE